MPISRRTALKSLGVAAAAAPIFRLKAQATSSESSSFRLQAEDPILTAIAEVVLPTEADRKAAVAAFTAWIANYKEGADTDHGYGNTRVRATGPSPARNYAAQIAALDDFSSAAAQDLCYRAAIGREACRLPGSEKKPAPLAPRASRVAPRASRLAPRS
jgi:hypothetical protein